MASIKIVLRKETKQDGTSPLAIRITKDRRSSYIYLDYSIMEKDWDAAAQRVKKSHFNATRLNNMIAKKLSEAMDKTLDIETHKEEASSSAIRKQIKRKAGATFFPQAELYLALLKTTGKFNRHSADKPRIERFREFLQGKDIAFSDITVGLLNRFSAYLKGTRNISERTIINHLVVIRSVFGHALKEGVTEKKYSPFGEGKIVIKFPESTKVGITKEDVERLENLVLEKPNENHARNIWLFCYYFAGMRISDVLRLRWADFQDARLHYTMGKNKKAGSVKAIDKALAILAQYEADKTGGDDLIFPDLKKVPDFNDEFEVQRQINVAVNRIGRILRKKVVPKAGISGKVNPHVARHTFATLAGDKIPVQLLQKLYRHSTVVTTIGYQSKFIHKDTDEALEAVIGS